MMELLAPSMPILVFHPLFVVARFLRLMALMRS
jgi:hypothetical protein